MAFEGVLAVFWGKASKVVRRASEAVVVARRVDSQDGNLVFSADIGAVFLEKQDSRNILATEYQWM